MKKSETGRLRKKETSQKKKKERNHNVLQHPKSVTFDDSDWRFIVEDFFVPYFVCNVAFFE